MKKNPVTREKYFVWSDAWVFASLAGTVGQSGAVEFDRLIACGDLLNHAILSDKEIRDALLKLHRRGLVEVKGKKVLVLALTEVLHTKIRGMRGGLFSIPDNALKVLNSPRTDLPNIDEIPDVAFITADYVKNAYKSYVKLISASG